MTLAEPFPLALFLLAGCVLVAHLLRQAVLWGGTRDTRAHLWPFVWTVASLGYLCGTRIGALAPAATANGIGMPLSMGSSLVAMVALLVVSATLGGAALRRRQTWAIGALLAVAFMGEFLFQRMAPSETTVLVDRIGMLQRVREVDAGFLPFWLTFTAVGTVACLVLSWRSGAPEKERITLAVGLVLYGACAINDILLTAGVIQSAFLFQYAFLFVGTALDLIAASRMVQLSAHLGEAVEARTRELGEGHRMMADALAKSEAATRARAEFLANMSHEIRTPMHGIIGMTDLVIERETRPVERERLTMVRTAAESLLRLLSDVLDYARLGATPLHLDPAEFDLRVLVEEVVAVAVPQAARKGLDLAVDISPVVPSRVLGDRMRVRQVLVNLVDNAVKFTDRGEVDVRVELVDRDATHAVVRLDVHDTGPGIAVARHSAIFEPFPPADGVTSRRAGGTGLGLAICREIVSGMAGTIALDSSLGTGSTFSVTLRFAVPERATRRPEPSPLVGFSALVADASPASARAVERLLANWRARVVVVTDAAALEVALDLARRHARPFNLAILDSRVTGEDGVALAARVKGSGSARAVALLLGSEASTADVARARAETDGHCLVKPVRHDDLLDLVVRVSVPGDRDPGGLRPLAMLLVEDHPVNRRLLVALLERAGHRVTAVESGRAALEVFAQGRFDVVLMDVGLPGMDGVDVTLAIRARESAGSRVPVIALTGQARTGDHARFATAGIDGMVSKPVRAEELDAELKRVLGDAEPIAEARVLDLAVLRARVADDDGLLRELVGLFLEDIPEMRRRLRDSWSAGDVVGLARAAHHLKGAAANLAAEATRNAVIAVEDAARGGELPVEGLMARLEQDIERLLPVLTGLAAPIARQSDIGAAEAPDT